MHTDNVEYTGSTGWIEPPNDIRPASTGDITC